MVGRPIRVMVVGSPNVGKSFLHQPDDPRGKRGQGPRCRTGRALPGRTVWFTVGKGFELLDTPGVLWPKFEDPIVGEHLAFTGAVRDEILDCGRAGLPAAGAADGAFTPNAVNTRI